MGQVVHVDFRWCTKHLGRHVESGDGKVLQFPFRVLAALRSPVVRRGVEGRRELPMTISASLLPPNVWP